MRLPLLVALAVLLLAPAAASASWSAPCVPGTASPSCTWWSGKVTFVDDGDTVDVRVAGRVQRVRITGIQAMEMTRYSRIRSRRRGECHSLAATASHERLIRRGRWRERLAAQSAASHSRARPRRSVWVKAGGRWRDVARTQLSGGHALWLPNQVEWAHNAEYDELADLAAAAGRNLWDTDACRPGPDADVPLRVTVNWDADGNDFQNPNGEWIRVENRDPSRAISLAGWWVRDSYLRRFVFPSWATVPAGGAVRVHVGSGENAARDFYWGQAAPAFENFTGDERGMGDGGYLFDPDGDLRGWMTYPCRAACG
jgi:endonuclease YncB( thermonuclease family)